MIQNKINIYGIEIEFIKDKPTQIPIVQKSFLSTKRRYLSVAITDLQDKLQVNLVSHFNDVSQDLAHKVAKLLIHEAKRKIAHAEREKINRKYHRDCRALTDWVFQNKIIEA